MLEKSFSPETAFTGDMGEKLGQLRFLRGLEVSVNCEKE